MTIKYPANEITPHGWYALTKGDEPVMRLRSYDGSADFYLMGGYSIADRFESPECVQIPRDGLKGLIPPWRHIDQKGATEDGVTQIDALYEPIEVEMNVMCRGRDGRRTRQVTRDLIASLDAKQESKLEWITPDMGYWWAPVRWFKGAPTNPIVGAQQKRQPLSLRLRADSGFWRSYDDTASFGFTYDSMSDPFTTDHSADHDLGSNWPQYYTGAGGGYCASAGGQARWYESGSDAREVVNGPFKDFDTDTDNQVIEIEIGSLPEIGYPRGAFNDIWGRMGHNVDGTWDGNGIRARIGLKGWQGWIELARFNDFVKTTLFEKVVFFRPRRKEKFTLVCGVPGEPRMFRVLRNGLTVLSHKEIAADSELGANFRGVGFGLAAGPAIGSFDTSQKSPAWVEKISAGDNSTVTQYGFLKRTNIGDQPMYDDYIFFGPGTCTIYNGPGSSDAVTFGPLKVNQSAMIRTDPRKRGVYDLNSTPAAAITGGGIGGLITNALNSLGNNSNAILDVIQSIFGIFSTRGSAAATSGSLYALLNGRFSDNAAIPPKSPGNPAQPYYVKVGISGGTADSKIIASGTPLRRYPL